MRLESTIFNGNYGSQNTTFKVLRRNGYQSRAVLPTKISFKNEGKTRHILKLLFHDPVKKKITGKPVYTQKEWFAWSFVFHTLARDLTFLAYLEKSTLPAISAEGKSDAIFLERKQLCSQFVGQKIQLFIRFTRQTRNLRYKRLFYVTNSRHDDPKNKEITKGEGWEK